jgi:hypothetical protein
MKTLKKVLKNMGKVIAVALITIAFCVDWVGLILG